MPPLDSRVKRFLDTLAAGNAQSGPETSVAERRAALAELLKLSGAEIAATVEERTIPAAHAALGVRIVTPAGAADALLPGLIYFHGGGLVAGSVATHEWIARALAQAGRCRIVSVDYRLAPEQRFPAAIDDALAAARHIGAHALDFGIDESRLGVCGDSAGGTLAAAVCHGIAQHGGPRLALQVLICPILDHSRGSESRRLYAAGYLLDRATLQHDLLHYLPPGTDLADPRVSPLCAAQLRGVPPTIVHTAEFDPLRDEGRRYFERLTHVGAAVSYTCHPGMIHLFYGLGAVIPYARTAFDRIGTDIRAIWR
ncbi:MAG TPA: alpha/beta hydrolase [Steroidobacteraceae bacterium]|nr:alpha/beta hydrolase [Steroidobacteraceae bacterium]